MNFDNNINNVFVQNYLDKITINFYKNCKCLEAKQISYN